GDLLIDTPDGEHVRLRDVAELRVAPNPVVIKRDAVSRYIDVEATVRGRALGPVLQGVERRLETLRFPLGYRAEVINEQLKGHTVPMRMVGYGVAATVAIFLLLQAALGSWRLATLCLLTVPAALAGGALAAFASGHALTLASLAGFFAALGIAGRNAIMLLSHYRHLEREESEPLGRALILRGAREQLMPILVTAAAMGL